MRWAFLPVLFAEPLCDTDSCDGLSLLALRKGLAAQPDAGLYSTADFDYPCVLDFEWRWPAGIGDSLFKLTYMVKLARAYGCAVVVPPPWQMLRADLNLGQTVDHAWTWDRYVRVPACLLSELPESLSISESELRDAMPSQELMNSISEASGKVAVVRLRFSDDFDPLPGFYNPLPGLDKTFSDQIDELIMHGKKEPEFEYFEKPAFVNEQATAIMASFKDGAMMSLHLRRGDRVRSRDSGHDDDPAALVYKAHCSDVANVLRAVDMYRNQSEACLAATNIFVATDSNEIEYNTALRDGLLLRFKAVHFEQDFPQLDYGDNYLTFFVDEAVMSSAVCNVRFRPQNQELIAKVCGDTS